MDGVGLMGGESKQRIKYRIRINEKEVCEIKLKNDKKFKFRIIRDN